MRSIKLIALTILLLFFIAAAWGFSASLTELPPLSTPTTAPEKVEEQPLLQKTPVQQPASAPSVKQGGNTSVPQEKSHITNPSKVEVPTSNLHPGFPFYPLLIQVEGGQVPSLDDFTGAPECGVCHKQIYEQWKGSMHAAAFTDPIWRAMVAVASEETGGKTDKFCIGCHTPIGLITGDVKNIEEVFSKDTDLVSTFGVQCDACHVMSENKNAEAVNGDPGNGSFLMSPGKTKRGPYETCDAKEHAGMQSSLHVTSKICANCHQTFKANVPVEQTYDEWKHSIYAQKGIQCQDCHMMPVDKAIEAARTLQPPVLTGPASELRPNRTPFFPHWFLGANVPMAQQNGFQDHAREMMHRLQTAAALEMEVSDAVVTPGQIVKVIVKVRNVAAGHNLPTGLVELRQMWVDIQASDQEGRVFYHSGKLTDAGDIEQGSTIFNAYAVDKNGQQTIKPWEIDHFLWNHTISPRGMAVVSYTFQIPSGIRKEVRITVRLRYRSYPQAFINMLLKSKAFTVPVIDMVEKRIVLPVASQ